MYNKYVGTEMILFHYSNKNPLSGNIIEGNEEGVAVELSLKNLKVSINAGDPMAVIYKTDSHDCKVKGCHVTGMVDGKGVAEMKMDTEFKGLNRRFYERLPVSIYTDIKDDDRKKRFSGVLKDISKNGLLLYSKEVIPENSRIKMNVFLENTIIFMEARIVRIYESPYYNRYGLYIPGEDLLSLNNLYKCLKQTCEYYMKKLMEEYRIFVNFDGLEYPNASTENHMEQMLNKSMLRLEGILKRSRP